uniref:RuvB-like helicase n=1 Tax=Hippocampus comes TaxID=109280 RepID=A0A3Q2XS23_HIPCM
WVTVTATMKIEEVKSTTKTQRIASHSHVKGLGLDEAEPDLLSVVEIPTSLSPPCQLLPSRSLI